MKKKMSGNTKNMTDMNFVLLSFLYETDRINMVKRSNIFSIFKESLVVSITSFFQPKNLSQLRNGFFQSPASRKDWKCLSLDFRPWLIWKSRQTMNFTLSDCWVYQMYIRKLLPNGQYKISSWG